MCVTETLMKELEERSLPKMSSFSFNKKLSELNKKKREYYVICNKNSLPFLLGNQTTMLTISVTTIMSMSIMFKVVKKESIQIDLDSMWKKAVKTRPMPKMFLGEIMIKEVVVKEAVLLGTRNTNSVV